MSDSLCVQCVDDIRLCVNVCERSAGVDVKFVLFHRADLEAKLKAYNTFYEGKTLQIKSKEVRCVISTPVLFFSHQYLL